MNSGKRADVDIEQKPENFNQTIHEPVLGSYGHQQK
jgi:hypothetical protein